MIKITKTKSEMKGENIELEQVESNEGASPNNKFNINFAALMRESHEDPSQKGKNESTETHYVRKFIFKVNNTLSITKVFLDKDSEKSQDLEAHTQNMEIGKIETIGAEHIKELRRITKEVEKSQKKQSLEEDNMLPRSYHPQDRVITQEPGHP